MEIMSISCFICFVGEENIVGLEKACIFGLADFLGTRRYLPCPGMGDGGLLSGHRDLPEEKCNGRGFEALVRSATPSPNCIIII